MYLLDNILKDKFLYNISILFSQYIIEENNPRPKTVTAIVRFLTISEYYKEEIFEIYTEYYKKNFIVLEFLAAKQGLDRKRQAFSIVRNHISRTNIKLTISDIGNLYSSHIYRRIIIAPEIIASLGLQILNPK